MDFSIFSLILASDGAGVVNPIYEGMTLVGPIAISVVVVLSVFYGIFLGVKYAKAEDESSRANMQKTLVNFIIGAVTVWILLAILYAIRRPIANLISGSFYVIRV